MASRSGDALLVPLNDEEDIDLVPAYPWLPAWAWFAVVSLFFVRFFIYTVFSEFFLSEIAPFVSTYLPFSGSWLAGLFSARRRL
jgi:hypothetical protein